MLITITAHPGGRGLAWYPRDCWNRVLFDPYISQIPSYVDGLSVASNRKHRVEIFSDGACKGNPGPGGYGAILKYGQKTKEISGFAPETTNNRMEMMAVIEALRQIKRPCNIKVVTDSNYLVKGMTEWMPGWIRRNWLNSQKKPVLNKDLWERLLKLSRLHQIEWEWVKGHHGHPENERCDQLARGAIKNSLNSQ